MNAIKATWTNGQVILEDHPNWPEGRQLVVLELPQPEPTGIPDEDRSNTPEAVADWLKWYDTLEPLVFSPDEEADTEAWLKRVNDYSTACSLPPSPSRSATAPW